MLRWLLRLFRPRQSGPVTPWNLGQNAVTLGGVVFNLKLTDARLDALRSAGFPVDRWAQNKRSMVDEIFSDRTFMDVTVALLADQVPPDWPPGRIVDLIFENAEAVTTVMSRAVAGWHWRDAVRDACPERMAERFREIRERRG
jgi:hypothetical protein